MDPIFCFVLVELNVSYHAKLFSYFNPALLNALYVLQSLCSQYLKDEIA